MARITGVEKGGSLLARFSSFMSRRMVGRVVRPVKVHALSTPALWGFGQMELVQGKLRRVPKELLALALGLAARRIGCPF